jgi:hypothetical protein
MWLDWIDILNITMTDKNIVYIKKIKTIFF